MSNLDDRIAAALRAAAERVSDDDLRPESPPTAPGRPLRTAARWTTPLLAAAVVVGIVLLGVAVANHRPHGNRVGSFHGPSTSSAPSTSTTSQSTPPATTSSSRPHSSATATFHSYCFFGDIGCKGFHTYYVPMWPFANIAQAAAAETQALACRTERCPYVPNRDFSDPGATALGFVRGYLGFADITRVTSTSVAKDQAHIGVGYLNPNGKPVTAAVIHLVKYERAISDKFAPWEVVGTDDTSFSLETPTYASRVGNSFSVGGHITGVDENIHVWVLHTAGQTNTTTRLKDYCCLPAGGQNSPWTVHLTIPKYSGIQVSDVLTIVASTGGHVQQHERFAVQGVYVQS